MPMTTSQRLTALCLCLMLITTAFTGLAESAPAPQPAAQTTAEATAQPIAAAQTATAADIEAEPTLDPMATLDPNIEVEGFATDDEEGSIELDAQGATASLEGLTPLYTTKIKPFVANGESIRMRAEQSGESEVVCIIKKGELITIYAVHPTYVLAEYNGNVGYIIRTWIDEDVHTIDPVSTPPYGVTLSQYVATAAQPAKIYAAPALDAPVNDIVIGEGSKIAVLEFVDGFAKILYWRSYGYIDAALLTDIIPVSPTEDPLSADTPIAAFASYFEYGTGSDGNEGRCLNIVRSCELMTRTLQPGESLDFNSQIGPYKRANGYHPAPVLLNGGSQLGYGGGTCQSSSTLYNTIRQLSGLTVLKRRPHGPGCARYLPMHQDAAVGNSQLNLVFRNDYDFPVRIEAFSKGEGSILIQIFR